MPLFILDIWSDGRSKPATDDTPEGPGDWRWFHWDLADDALEPWAEANLPEIPATALTHTMTRPRCDQFEQGLILNLRGVNLNPGQHSDQMISIRMWVTERTVVTVRQHRVFSLEEIRQRCVAGNAPESTAAFVTDLVDALGKRLRDAMVDIDHETEAFETLYEDDFDLDASVLKTPRRKVIRMLRYMNPQREALKRLLELETPVLEHGDRIALRESVNLVSMSVEGLAALNARLEALHDAAHAATSEQHGRNSYGLALVAAVFLPLGFVTGLFGVNVGGMPGLESPVAFTILCISLVALGAASVLILRWMRLL